MIEGAIQAKEVKALPDGWRWVRLGEVCEKPQYGYTASAESAKVGPKLLRITDIQNGEVNWESVPYCRCGAEASTYALKSGDILFARTGGTTGKSFLIKDIPSEAIFASYLIRVRTKDGLIPEYLYFFLQSDMYWNQVLASKRGGAQPNMNATLLGGVVFPLPPLPEQKRIAARVQELMQDVERARAACEAQLKAAKALPRAYLRQVFESDEAKKWERRRLGELFDVQQGVAMSPHRREGISPRPFLRTLNVLWGRVDLSALDKMDFTDDEVSKLSLKPGDLLVCEGGEVGRTAIWRGEIDICLYQNHIHRLRKIDSALVPDFFMYWMQAAFQVFSSYSGQESITTIPNLSGNRLKAFLFPFPSVEVQKRIAAELQAKMEEAERLVASIEKQLEAIKALPQAILSKAFSGEL